MENLEFSQDPNHKFDKKDIRPYYLQHKFNTPEVRKWNIFRGFNSESDCDHIGIVHGTYMQAVDYALELDAFLIGNLPGIVEPAFMGPTVDLTKEEVVSHET